MVNKAGSQNSSAGIPPNSGGKLPLRDRFGLCQWFHYLDYRSVDRTLAYLDDLGVRHLRTGISWADFHRPQGRKFYDWLFARLRQTQLEVLVSVWHTPPSIAEGGTCSSPPLRLEDYGDFIGHAVHSWGDAFHAIELWNEPNNRLKWHFENFDPGWRKFARMVRHAAWQAKGQGMPTVLGGMIPVDHHWLEIMKQEHALEAIDVVAIHGFPGMWWPDRPCWEWYSHWQGWSAKLDYIAPYCDGRPVWVTEAGRSSWDPDMSRPDLETLQRLRLEEALDAPAERMYWYSCIDLDPARPCIELTEDSRMEPNEYHMGLVTFDGHQKEAYHLLRQRLREEALAAGRVDAPAIAVTTPATVQGMLRSRRA